MRQRRRRERLLARATRRIASGAPAWKVCRELGTDAPELADWCLRHSPESARLAAGIARLEAENRRLRVRVDDLGCHRRMLLDAFDLLLPPLRAAHPQLPQEGAATSEPWPDAALDPDDGFVM